MKTDFGVDFLERSLGNMKDPEVLEGFFRQNWKETGKKLFVARCVHGNRVEIIEPGTFSGDGVFYISNADGLVSPFPGVVLSVTFADCFPVVLTDPGSGVFGIAHCGHRGISSGILENMVSRMSSLDADPENIEVFVGPGICQDHYEFDKDSFQKSFPNEGEWAELSGPGKVRVDLSGIIMRRLFEAGVSGKNLYFSGECTYELPEKYFSARREKFPAGKIKAGLALVWRK